MAEFNEAHPLWEPAAALYGVWVKNQGLAQMMAPQFHNAHEREREAWIGIAQVAKDLFGGYQDELVDKIDQIYAVVRANVSATKWEKISRRLALADMAQAEVDRHPYGFVHYDPELRKAEANLSGGLDASEILHGGPSCPDCHAGVDERHADNCPTWFRNANGVGDSDRCPDCGLFQTTPHSAHPLTDEQRKAYAAGASAGIVIDGTRNDLGQSDRTRRFTQMVSDVVGGPAVLPGIPPFSSFPLNPARAAKRSAEHAHARINALQGELAWWLTCIEAHATGKDPNKQLIAKRSDKILASFQRADERVANEQGWQ